jgi:hypothetical protein
MKGVFLPLLLLAALPGFAFEVTVSNVPWQQVSASNAFTVCMEREELTSLDPVSRMVFAVQTGRAGVPLEALSVGWHIRRDQTIIHDGQAPIPSGMLDAVFLTKGLEPGRYDVSAELQQGGKTLARASAFFRLVEAARPPQAGQIPLNLPRGVPLKAGTFPVSAGVPFPKGALWTTDRLRVVDSEGTPVPAQFAVRSRWGLDDSASIRWLGVDFQAGPAPAWWPARSDTRYRLEFGPNVQPVSAQAGVSVTETPDGLRVDTGPLQFRVRRAGFNLLDQVRLQGEQALPDRPGSGLYLVDHEGAIYRAANDTNVRLSVEERGPLRTVIRAEGWYVKDGTAGRTLDWKLPTDRLCRHVTRIEAYAGKPYVRVLTTWILTFDSLSVRLKDVGLSLPVTSCTGATFGVESTGPVSTPVPPGGVRLVQHLPHAFAVEDDAGRTVATGKHSAGWVFAETEGGLVGIGHRDTWQRFPKEFEVRPDTLTIHVWPAHGRLHPEIDELAEDQIHKLWFAHQGPELNMAEPWKYYWAVCDIRNEFRAGIYSGAGQTLAGVHASAMGAAQTSDLLIQFAPRQEAAGARDTAACFQAAPHMLPDTRWLCDSLALGWIQPYDPERMPGAEEVIENLGKAAWETQNGTGDYGMWIYRAWHNGPLKAPGKWDLYRLYNGTHHYEAYVPWMLYARSGDPGYLTIGQANIRMLTDAQTIHYDNPAYPHREMWAQGRLVGSTRHTNGFVPWGGDHAVLGHLTCYNGMLLAYYLTGDLRLREVVVDEWQHTLLTDRANPQFALANRSAGAGRDANNSLGELLDLYQLTHAPAILGYLPNMIGLYLGRMNTWGLPSQNMVLHYGSEQAKKQILEGVADFRQTNGKPLDPRGLWYGPRPGIFALAWIIDPSTRAYVDAWSTAGLSTRRPAARRFRAQDPGPSMFSAADALVYLPRVLYAVVRSGGDLSPGALKLPQPLVSRQAIVKKERDQEFEINLDGTVGEGGLVVTVTRPDGRTALSAVVPAGVHKPWTIRVPPDGLTGDYTITVPRREPKDRLTAPLTALPEVYLPNNEKGKPGWWWQHAATTYFVRSRGEQREPLAIGSHGANLSVIISRDGMETLTASKSGSLLHAEIGPEGVWVVLHSTYAAASNCPIMSVSPEKWFVPDRLKP